MMTNKELLQESKKLTEEAEKIKHPLLPLAIKNAIVRAAVILNELVKREVLKNG